jgi:hypothetical protein
MKRLILTYSGLVILLEGIVPDPPASKAAISLVSPGASPSVMSNGVILTDHRLPTLGRTTLALPRLATPLAAVHLLVCFRPGMSLLLCSRVVLRILSRSTVSLPKVLPNLLIAPLLLSAEGNR